MTDCGPQKESLVTTSATSVTLVPHLLVLNLSPVTLSAVHDLATLPLILVHDLAPVKLSWRLIAQAFSAVEAYLKQKRVQIQFRHH